MKNKIEKRNEQKSDETTNIHTLTRCRLKAFTQTLCGMYPALTHTLRSQFSRTTAATTITMTPRYKVKYKAGSNGRLHITLS